MLGMMIGSFLSFVLGWFTPAAGPDWMWAGGRNDFVRGLYFRPNGTYRRFGRVALMLTLLAGSAALLWVLHRFSVQ